MQWAKQLSGYGFEGATDITVDSTGYIYITGNFQATTDFDPGPAAYSITSLGFGDIFIEKLNPAGDLVWVKSLGGTGNEGVHEIMIDKYGNIYTMGYFGGTADFDPGLATYNLSAVGNYDLFISKLDMNGNFVWAKQIGDTNVATITTFVLDNDGFFYTGGFFKGTIDFDPGILVYNLISATPSYSDIFISKFDLAGNLIWAKNVGGILDENIFALALDKNKNIYYTGNFYGSVDFDPGINTFTLSATGMFNADAFISKLDSNGGFIWAKQLAGTSNPVELTAAIAINDSNQVYVLGTFADTIDFDPGPAVYNLYSPPVNNIVNTDSYVAKYDASGNFIWVRQFMGTDHTYLGSLALDTLGDIYLSGDYLDTTDFDPGPGQYNLVSNDYFDICIVKINGTGDFQWAKTMGGTFADHCTGIATDKSGNVFTTGYFYDVVDFDIGIDTFNLITLGNSWDTYIHKLAQCNININTVLNANTITALATNSTFQWIRCSDSSIIPGATAQSYTPLVNGYYAVIVSIGNCIDTSACVSITEIGVSVYDVNVNAPCKIYPNPSNGVYTLELKSDAELFVTNTIGQIIYQGKFSAGIHSLNIENECAGVYFVKLMSEGKWQAVKLLKKDQ